MSDRAILPRVLAGPAFARGAEPYAAHLARLGALPGPGSSPAVVAAIDASGLLGRGGAGFPVGRKWRSVAEHASGRGAVVLVNGAEGEPLSHKDQALMQLRPHLVLDGAQLAAQAVGADEIILYVGEAHASARRAIEEALPERAAARTSRGRSVPIRLVDAPDRYVAGEESAAVHFLNAGDARPTNTPPRPFERGIRGRPTLVQNVESIAHAALIGRYGPEWYREAGRGETRGTSLVTLSGPDGKPRVIEVELGVTIGELAGLVGTKPGDAQAVLLGGYFGGWLRVEDAWEMPLDPAGLRTRGWSIGAGVVSFLAANACPVEATAKIADYMAAQSAAQCGPCVYGLRSLADATTRIARREASVGDLANIERWAGQVRDRGACRHPDGAVGMLTRALEAFGDEFLEHARSGRCRHDGRAARIELVA